MGTPTDQPPTVVPAGQPASAAPSEPVVVAEPNVTTTEPTAAQAAPTTPPNSPVVVDISADSGASSMAPAPQQPAAKPDNSQDPAQ